MSSSQPTPELASTRTFWDSNPCGVHDTYEAQKRQRYAMEPWLLPILDRIAKRHGRFLEVGCGQGVDSIQICSAMAAGGRYNAIDYSPRSVEVATGNAQVLAPQLTVTPTYQVGNAESLEFPDGHFDAVWSMGVIHHTADPAQAIREVHRVLEPGGKAYICLYRKPSLKVGAAKALRALQHGLDALFGTERCLHTLIRKQGSHSKLFGTMFLECFGVPYMEWYNRAEIMDLFKPFPKVEPRIYGPNLGRLSTPSTEETPFGYFWAVEATK